MSEASFEQWKKARSLTLQQRSNDLRAQLHATTSANLQVIVKAIRGLEEELATLDHAADA